MRVIGPKDPLTTTTTFPFECKQRRHVDLSGAWSFHFSMSAWRVFDRETLVLSWRDADVLDRMQRVFECCDGQRLISATRDPKGLVLDLDLDTRIEIRPDHRMTATRPPWAQIDQPNGTRLSFFGVWESFGLERGRSGDVEWCRCPRWLRRAPPST